MRSAAAALSVGCRDRVPGQRVLGAGREKSGKGASHGEPQHARPGSPNPD